MTPARLKPFLLKKVYRAHHRAIEHLLNDRFPIEGHVERMIDRIHSLNRFLFCDTTKNYLPQLLSYDDRNAAAFSVENRVPFVDHRLVEYVNGIPSIFKLYRGWSKWLLRLAMRDLLPEKILWRKDKLGFPTPEKQWLTHSLSPVPQFIKRQGLRRYDAFAWRLFLADRLMNRGADHE
jgi:asparagine synthetase B (glutamine-hydrolysing)